MSGGWEKGNAGSIILVQPDWEEAIQENRKSFWVTFKEVGKPGDHDKVSLPLGFEKKISEEEKFEVSLKSKSCLLLKHLPSGKIFHFVASSSNIKPHQGKSVNMVSVGSGGLGISSAAGSNNVLVWESISGTVRRELVGHVGEVYCSKLFPSGVVVLSGGADMQIKVWSAQDGSCPVTFTGHTRAITGIDFIERGKNVLSVSKDGSVRLWNCASGSQVAILAELEDCLTSCHVGKGGSNGIMTGGQGDLSQDILDEVSGKVVAVGGEEGTVALLSVAGQSILFKQKAGCAVNAVTVTGAHVCAGCEDGSLRIFDRQGAEKEIKQDSSSPVLCLTQMPGRSETLMVGRQDGTVEVWRLEGGSGGGVVLTGPDTEPVYGLGVDGEFVYSACRDGLVRKYNVDTILHSLDSQ